MRLVLLSLVVLLSGSLFASLVAQEAQPKAGASAVIDNQIKAASEALEGNPDDVDLLARRAMLHAAAGEPKKAIADFDRLLKLEPKAAAAYDARGSEYFKLGQIDKSIADFDRYLELQPDQEPWHWKRGISYYYAERFDEGRKQFEGYQTVDDNDVENAVWRYLCMARDQGPAAARADMLKIKRDLRVPMMEIYELYAGRLEPDDVLAAAEAGSPSPEQLNTRLFYAHLYLGLYFETVGELEKAKHHILLARQHKIGHYMWNVADVHAKQLQQAAN